MKNHKIIYIGQFIPPAGNAVAQRVRANAHLFRALGYDVVLVGCDKEIATTKRKEDTEFETYITPYPSSISAWLKRCVSVDDYLKIIDSFDGVDIVITCDLQSIAQSRLRRALKKRNIKYVEDTMEWIRHSRKKNIRTIIKDVDTYFRMSKQHIKTHNLISISNYLHSYYIGKGCNSVNIPVLIDYYADKWMLSEQKYIPNATRTLIYAGDAGSIGYKERIDKVVELACGLYRNGTPLRVEMIGLDRDAFVKQCPSIAADPDFDNVAFFYGRQSHEFCLKKIRMADASILIRENSLEMQAGFPTKLSESLRLGVPPIITNIGGYDKYIEDYKDCFFVKDTDNDTILDVLKKFTELTDSELMVIHDNCESNKSFHYMNYLDSMKNFISKI